MSRYFIHLRDGTDEVLDPEGREYRTLEALKAAVLQSARDVIVGDVRNGIVDLRYRLDAENEKGEIVHSLPFNGAVTVIFP